MAELTLHIELSGHEAVDVVVELVPRSTSDHVMNAPVVSEPEPMDHGDM